MRILLIKPKHIGDTLILTPTIVAIKAAYPEAEIWVLVRRGCEGILAGCPEVARVLTLTAVEKRERHRGDWWLQVKVALRLLSARFDYVFELGDGYRGRLFGLFARSPRHFSVLPAGKLKWPDSRLYTVSSREWTTCHRVVKDYQAVAEFLPLPAEIPPLRFDRTGARSWPPAAGLTDFCVMQIGKRQSISRWLPERWEEVGRWLLERSGAIVLTSGSDKYELEQASLLQQRLGPRVLATKGQADWSQVADLLFRARLYVGLDTAAMHLAAACQCPAVALFGPTLEVNWHPWRAPYRIVTSGSYVHGTNDDENRFRAKSRTMDLIEVRDVIAACEEMLAPPKTA
jgi:heptosyltransferase-3